MNKKIFVASVLVGMLLGGGGYMLLVEEPPVYECYYWNLDRTKEIRDKSKDIIICNYPGTTDMYHSYLKEKDMERAMKSAGASFTYSGKHPSNTTFEEWKNKTKEK